MIRVKEELGKEAMIVSVKHIKPKGLFRLFKKPFVEVTAAIDDRSVSEDANMSSYKSKEIREDDMASDELEEFKAFIGRYSSLQEEKDIGPEVDRPGEIPIQGTIEELFDRFRVADNEKWPLYFNLRGETYYLKIYKKQ